MWIIGTISPQDEIYFKQIQYLQTFIVNIWCLYNVQQTTNQKRVISAGTFQDAAVRFLCGLINVFVLCSDAVWDMKNSRSSRCNTISV